MLSRIRGLAIFCIGLILGFLILWQVLIPYRHRLAERQVARGDIYLIAGQYSEAGDEYKKALTYEDSNPEAINRLRLTKEGPVDIRQLRDFYDQNGLELVVQKIDAATKSYPNPKSALQAGVDLYSAKDYVYAQYPIETALGLDPDYPEALHYQGLVYRELAKIDAIYSQKAAESWKKRDALTPKYLK